MKSIKDLFKTVTEKLEGLAKGNAVVAQPISVGNRHVIPLCELSVGFGGGGGVGEGDMEKSGEGKGKGVGGGVGGGAKAAPVAVLVIEDGKVRIEDLGR